MPGSRGGAVHLMLSMQNEQDINGAGQLGVWPVAGLQICIQHVQEVLSIAQTLVGRRVHPPAGSVIGQGCNGWDLTCRTLHGISYQESMSGAAEHCA